MRTMSRSSLIAIAVAAAAVVAAIVVLAIAIDRSVPSPQGRVAVRQPPPSSTTSGAAPGSLPSIDVATESLARKLATGGGTSDQWTLLARSYEELGRDADAATAYARAVELDPGNVELAASLRSAKTRTGR